MAIEIWVELSGQISIPCDYISMFVFVFFRNARQLQGEKSVYIKKPHYSYCSLV